MHRDQPTDALVARARAVHVVLGLALAMGCHGSVPAPVDATAAEPGAGAPDGEREAGALDADGESAHASEADASGATAEASLPGVQASFVGGTGATWEGTGSWLVEIVLAEVSSGAQPLELALAGTSQRGTDFTLDTTLEVKAGSSVLRVPITILDDREREASETLTLTLIGSTPLATFTLRIADDDDERWPSDDPVREVDAARAFPGENLSGLAYRPVAGAPTALFMVRNSPAQLYQLSASGTVLSALTQDGWAQGKTLLFPGGTGAPDAEGITLAEWSSPMVYVVSERDGSGPSAPTVLAYDTSVSGASLTATSAFSLAGDLRSLNLGANAGPEALTWVPDSYLTSAGFLDEASGNPYDPTRYPNHGSGLFFVGIEQTGGIYAYALDHAAGTATRVASVESGQAALMALEFDRDLNYLWAWCDDTCENRATILRVEDNPASPRKGRFTQRRKLSRPPSLANVNNEGMAIAPSRECSAGKKAILWVEDGTDEHVLRRGSVPCGSFLDAE